MVLNTLTLFLRLLLVNGIYEAGKTINKRAYTKLYSLFIPYLLELSATVKLKTDDRHYVFEFPIQLYC